MCLPFGLRICALFSKPTSTFWRATMNTQLPKSCGKIIHFKVLRSYQFSSYKYNKYNSKLIHYLQKCRTTGQYTPAVSSANCSMPGTSNCVFCTHTNYLLNWVGTSVQNLEQGIVISYCWKSNNSNGIPWHTFGLRSLQYCAEVT